MEFWEIELNGFRQSAEAWGVQVASATQTTQQEDEVLLTVSQLIDGSPSFDYLDQVTIYRNNSRWFEGRVSFVDLNGGDQSESIEVTLSSVWFDLERMSYLSTWRTGDPTLLDEDDNPIVETAQSSLIVLGEDGEGTKISVNQTIQDLINYAVSNGASIQLGSLPSTDISVWVTEYRDQTVGSLLRAQLRFHPDVITSMNYATSPPTLSFISRSAASSVSYIFGFPPISDVRLLPRKDLLVAGVHIDYIITSSDNGAQFREVETDSAGSSDRSAINVLNVSLDLQGDSITTQTQSLRSTIIPGVGSLSENSSGGRNWYKRHRPQLEEIDNVEDLEFVMEDFKFVQDNEPDPDDPLTNEERDFREADIGDFEYEFLSGQLDGWFEVPVRSVYYKGRVRYTGATESFSELQEETRRFFDLRGAAGEPEALIELRLNAVTEQSQNKTRTTDSTEGEELPVGVAAHYLSKLNTLQYEGSITLKDQEVPHMNFMGRVLNISGGKPEWTSMNAQIQSVSYNLLTGQTSISLGPAQSLAPQDILELQRLQSRNPIASNSSIGDSSVGGDLTAGTYETPQVDSLYRPPQVSVVCPLGLRKAEDGATVATATVSDGFSTFIIDEQTVMAADGDTIYLRIPWEAQVTDEILRNGGNIPSMPVIEVGSDLPDHDIPTKSSPNGNAYLALGKITGDLLEVFGCGNARVQFCVFGGFTIERFG